MDEVWVGVCVLIGVACLAVLTICILRVVNRRAASRESNRRPEKAETEFFNHYHRPTSGSGI
jgi:hypothetical protein